MGSIFQCLNPALTIASALAHRDPFVLPINRKEEADAAKRSFAGDSCRLVFYSKPYCSLFSSWNSCFVQRFEVREEKHSNYLFHSGAAITLHFSKHLKLGRMQNAVEMIDPSVGKISSLP